MSLLPTLVKGFIAEAAREVVPAIIERVKRKLTDNGIPVDDAVEKLMELQLAALVVACHGIADEFDAAEERGRAHPLPIELVEVSAWQCDECGRAFPQLVQLEAHRPCTARMPSTFETETPPRK